MSRVAVIGSINMDENIFLKHLPVEGETVFSSSKEMSPGGKGFNQAIAVNRFDNQVSFIGSVGKDALAEQFRAIFLEEGINDDYVKTASLETGKAWVCISETGSNSIIVNSGANFQLTTEDVAAAKKEIEASDLVLAQLEIPQQAVIKGFQLAKKAGKTTVLNPAPIQTISEELLRVTDIFIPNEIEITPFIGDADCFDTNTMKEQLTSLFAFGIQYIVITLGERGVAVYSATEEPLFFPAVQVTAVDTTAAGDSFIGAFVHYYLAGCSMAEVVQQANSFASLTVQQKGAYQSIPTKERFEQYKQERGL